MTTGERTSEVQAARVSYRPEQSTLVEDVESPSLPPRSSPEKDRPLLTLLTGPLQGTIIQLDSHHEVTLGRSKRASFLIPDPSLSRIHARVFRHQTPNRLEFYIEDCGSTNGTFVAEQRISAPTLLTDGARVGLGRRTELRFSLKDALEEQALLRMHESALRDRLTGAYNRGAFDDRLKSEFVTSQRRNSPLALLLFDIDHFKRLNDTYGHLAGDAVLREVSDSVQRSMRAEDVLARYGGEEFAIILKSVSGRSARVLAERVRVAVEEAEVEWNGTPIRVTVSIGVAHVASAHSVDSPAQLIALADAALYQAKHEGRNRVVMSYLDGAPHFSENRTQIEE
jgi:two-component system cell cycle response regulator